MKIYAIRESWDYEIYDLIDFYSSEDDAIARVKQLNERTYVMTGTYNPYTVEEVEVK